MKDHLHRLYFTITSIALATSAWISRAYESFMVTLPPSRRFRKDH